MKVIRHRNGEVSFRFTRNEQVGNSEARYEAIRHLCGVSGGHYSWLADTLLAHKDDMKYWSGLGTEAQLVVIKCLLNAMRRVGHAQTLDRGELVALFPELSEWKWDGEKSRWAWDEETGELYWKSDRK